MILCSTSIVAAREQPASSADADQGAKPNVLFLMMDDLNSWVGYHGEQPNVLTPNLDALAARGVWFRRAYCQSATCNPSRTSMMFGLLPSTSGVYQNIQNMRYPLRGFTSMPQHFRNHGYIAEEIGKVFHDGDRSSWDFVYGCGLTPEPDELPAHGVEGLDQVDWAGLDLPETAWGDTLLATEAAEFLSQPHDQPFFLGVGLVKPHLNWYAPQPYFDQYPLEDIVIPLVKDDDLDDVPPAGRQLAGLNLNEVFVEHGLWDDAVRGYLASISFGDAQIGRIIEALDNGPHADNTIIVFCSDHGFHLGEKLHWKKQTLWEEATRVPMLIVVPGVTPAGQPCEHPVNLVDLFPTLTTLCGIPDGDSLDGTNLVPLLEDPAAAWDSVGLSTEGFMNHAVRSQRWRYIRYADGSEELYDHDADPLEWHNLADMPGMDEIKAELAQWLPTVNAPTGFQPPSRLYVNPTAQGNGTGLTWFHALTDIRHAFAITNNAAGRDFEVWVAKGVYTPAPPGGPRSSSFILGTSGRSEIEIIGGFAGNESLITQRRPLENPSILSGDLNGDDGAGPDSLTDNCYHVLVGEGIVSGFVTLDGFVIRGGNANGDGWNSRGGGMYLERSSPLIRNCRFEQNSATQGGAVYISGGGPQPAKPKMVNCSFVDNIALADGAAVYVDDEILAPTTCDAQLERIAMPTLGHLTLADNHAQSTGGGVYSSGGSRPGITNSLLWGNSDQSGQTESSQIFGGLPVVSYCNIEQWSGQLGGTGNFGLFPEWAINGSLGLALTHESPCVDAGDPGFIAEYGFDLAHAPRIECGRVDIGAFEFVLGDFNSDGAAALNDHAAWMGCATGPDGDVPTSPCRRFDHDYDLDVDLRDFAGFASRLVECSGP